MENLGFKIRELRKMKGLSIVELSQKTGLSTGIISEIERSKVVPSINGVLKIANSLDVTIGYFFNEDNKVFTIQRKGQRKKILTNDNSREYELLSPIKGRKIEYLLIRLNGTEEREAYPTTHEGEECGYIIKGSMILNLNGEKHILHEGDSIYFESTNPHLYESYNNEECISIWAMTPPSW